MPSKIKTKNIKDGDRIAMVEYRHQFAIDIVTQTIRNLELEIASKQKAIREILSDRSLDQSPVQYMGKRILRLEIEKRRLERSVGLLEKNNKPVKVNTDTLMKKGKL